jgi:DNA-binding response OmpR family regulator
VQNREAVRVVLTDVMMPVMGGVTLIRALRAMAPRLLVLATSGLGDTADHSQLTSMGVDRVLTKPCGARDLLVAVQSLLHAPR